MTERAAAYTLAGLVIALSMGFGHYLKVGWLSHNVARYVWGVGWTLAAVTLVELLIGVHPVAFTWAAFAVAGAADLACYGWDWLRLYWTRQDERRERGEA